ncbi:hypothetical protein GCM10027019_26070 [Melaminivora jejuensis]|uniref:Ig-like domain-containing protein n=1 Tax=Melaminivora jejuensis TaxID=1267217 RepID=UPI001E65181E|nr:Ig-like domain-containing protein [Melaminivora jejuensis]UHJ65390.1 Ig-like domain-containing protein [Melaminivora jejuensis]
MPLLALAQVTAHDQTAQSAYNRWSEFRLSGTDDTPGGPYAISYAIASLPLHGTLGKLVATNGVWSVSYLPEDGYVGQDSFTYTASTVNGTSAAATIAVTMHAPVPPVANSSSYYVPFNTTADLLLGGNNPNYRSDPRVYYEPVAPPAHGSVVFGEYNAVAYTPETGYMGTDSFTFRVRHPVFGPSNVATATITVARAAPPVAQPGNSYVPHGTATAIALVAQDVNPGGPYALSYALATPPGHGSVAISGSSATYTPAAGHWGADSFTFTATSANGTSLPATVTLLVGQPVVLGLAAASLNDTGQGQCASGAAMNPCLPTTSGQDGSQGRDAQAAAGQLPKAGAGAAGFDFTALDMQGMAMAAGSHDCVADRTTGLVWSAQTLPAQSQAAAASAATAYSHCGLTGGWHLPTRRELLSIVHHGASGPAIDAGYFPDTASVPYWSADIAPGGQAWAVNFSDGATLRSPVGQTYAVRLVTSQVNQAPAITLGAQEIVLSNNERPGPRTYPGWATGISAGSTREAGQQLIATVRLLPVPGSKTLEFDEPPAIDLATGNLTFTVHHRLYPNPTGDHWSDGITHYWWTSSAGRVRVEVTLQDDGGTEGGGVDTTVKSFEIEVSPVPYAFDVNIKHPWKAACIPVSMHAQDIDTDMMITTIYPKRYWPYFKIKTYPSKGFLTDQVSYRAAPPRMHKASISVPLGDDLTGTGHAGMTGNRAPVAEVVSPWGFYVSTLCYVPFSSTFLGADSFTYTVIDVDDNESAPASVSIEIFEVI